MRPIKYLAFNGKELVPVISLDSMKDGEPIVLVSEDGSGDLPLKNLGKVPVYEWTGIADIYAGHIVRDKVGRVWVVDYLPEVAAFVFRWSNDRQKCQTYQRFNAEQKPLEILGHIATIKPVDEQLDTFISWLK